MKNRIRIFIFCFCSTLLIGCGSLTRRDRHQFILVRTSPPGAEIYYHGEKLGRSPAFVEVRRGENDSIQLRDLNGTVQVPLETKYRWSGSFWSNFIFVYFAPIGWAVDYFTGASREMQDPAIRTVTLNSPYEPQITGAIAPPQAFTSGYSDEGATLWQRYLPDRYPSIHVLPYKEKLEEFTTHGYDFDSKPGRENERELFGRLAITHVFESEFKDTSEGVELKGHYRNVFTNQLGPEEIIHAGPSKGDMTFAERFKNVINLVPNTVGMELSQADVVLSAASLDYQSATSRDETFWSQAAPYLSSIVITRQTLPRREAIGRWRFGFAPAIIASYRRLIFPTYTPIIGHEFGYLTVAGGLGPELGWQWGPNYLYINVIPIYGWHRLSWKNDDELHVASIGALTWRNETGYLYYLTERFSARFFIKATTSPGHLWNDAVQNISPGSTAVKSSTDATVGLALGFTWEPKRDFQKWTIWK